MVVGLSFSLNTQSEKHYLQYVISLYSISFKIPFFTYSLQPIIVYQFKIESNIPSNRP